MEETMNQQAVKSERKLHNLIREVDEAYRTFASKSGSMNTDYAGFACIALSDFRDALQAPELSCEDLQSLLRSGLREHRREHKSREWTKLVAEHIKRTANENKKP